MQQVYIVQSRMSHRCSWGKCNYILVPPCAHSLLEKKVNTIFFFFQPLVYVHNQMYKCRPLIIFENSSGRQNVLARMPACADSYQPSLLEKKCSVSFSAPICVLNHLLLVSYADNLLNSLDPGQTRQNFPAKMARM